MNLREPHTFIQSHELHSLSDSIEKEKIISIKKDYNKRRRTCKEIARINDIPQFRSELLAALDAPPQDSSPKISFCLVPLGASGLLP